MTNSLVPFNSAVPLGSLRKITRTLHESISRVATGLRVLGGNDAASQSLANTLTARAASFEAAGRNADSGVTLLELAESALLELNSLATRLKEVGIADTNTTNTSADTAALNSEAVYISDTIDSIVSSLTYNGVNVLGTSSRTYNVAINDTGNTQTIQPTTGIAATDINDATNSNNSMDTTIGEITRSLGAVAGSLASLKSYQTVSTTTAAHLTQAAANLQDTDYAEETAKITKQSLLKNYALAMVATANAEEIEKLKLLA